MRSCALRYLILSVLVLSMSCGRIQNSISVARLDCGAEAQYSGSYLRFVDQVGRKLDRSSLDIRSLDDQGNRSFSVTSKGCLNVDQPGLWLVRHKEKPEGLVVKIKASQQSGVQQLQDISHEVLKPECPDHDLAETLDLAEFLPQMNQHDQRGYAVHLKIRDRDWPWLNLAATAPSLIAAVVSEGDALVELELKNQFRFGEVTKKECQLRIDYTAPVSYPSFAKNLPVQYRSRPFYVLNAESDVSFVSESKDVIYHEACWQERKDWDRDLPLCENPQKIEIGKNLVSPSRKGFWQLQYRGVDAAGNKAGWSPPQIVLLEQTSRMESIKAKAANIASIVDNNPANGTARAMVSGLELYKLWRDLPTQFERDRLENIVMLSLHRPWLHDTIRQDIRVQDSADEMMFYGDFIGDGSLILTYQRNLKDVNNKIMELRVFNTKTREYNILLTEDWKYISAEVVLVSPDKKMFAFWIADSPFFWVGRVDGDNVTVQRAAKPDLEDNARPAAFINDNKQLVMLAYSGVLTYDLDDLRKEPKFDYYAFPDELESLYWPLSLGGTHYMAKNYEEKKMTWIPLVDESLPRETIDLNQLGFKKGELKFFDVLADGDYLVVITDETVGPCTYSILSRNAKRGGFDSKRISERAPCYADVKINKERDRVLINQGVDRMTFLWLNNLKNFAGEVHFPVLREDEGGIGRDFSPRFWAHSRQQELVAGSYESEKSVDQMVFWKPSADRTLQESYRINLPSRLSWSAYIFADELEVIVGYFSNSFFTAGYGVANRGEIKLGESICSPMDLTYGHKKLFVACHSGGLDVFDLSKTTMPKLGHIETIDEFVTQVDYEPINDLLIASHGGEQEHLWVWQQADLLSTPTRIRVFQSGIWAIATSFDGRYVATLPASEEDMLIKVFQLQNLPAEPLILQGNRSKTKQITFIGNQGLLVSGSEEGQIKIWDVDHPDFPGVTIEIQRGKKIASLTGIPHHNEFIVENGEQEIFHYKLDSLTAIRNRTCDFLKPYFQPNSGLTAEQRKLCE